MNTYPTYQAAKIANPDSEIYWYLDGALEEVFTNLKYRTGSENNLANPKKHCMTVKQFLEDGHKFVEGDMYVTEGAITPTTVGSGLGSECNVPYDDDDKYYVIKAKALEETNTYRYEKVTFEKASEAVAAWEDGELFTNISHDSYIKIENAPDVLTYLYRLYRRIEATERELEIEEMTAKLWGRDLDRDVRKLAAKLHSLDFRLVNGKG